MKENITVVNIMADGTICEDLSTYIGPDHPLPDIAKRLILDFIRDGRALKDRKE